MKHILLFTIFTLFTYFSQAQCVADSAEVYKKYTKKELQEDLAFLAAKIENVHANPFENRSKSSFKKEVAVIKSKLKDGLTKKDFYLLVAPLIGKLDDDIAYIDEYCIVENKKQQIKHFPLRFYDQSGKIVLIENGSGNTSLKVGEELIAINHIPIQEVIQKCSEYAKGNNLMQRKKVINNLGFFLATYSFQWKDSYDFTFASGETYHLSDISVEEYKMRETFPVIESKENNLPQLINYKVYQNSTYQNNAYLKIKLFYLPKFITTEKLAKEIKNVFIQIQKDSIKQLFVDIEYSNNNNAMLEKVLLSYFSDKPIKSFSATWRRSREYMDFLDKLGFKQDEYKNTKLGKSYIIPSNYIKPVDSIPNFTGTIYFFINKYESKDKAIFSAILQDNKIATIIGENPQNVYVNYIEEIINFTMPHTKLEFGFGVKKCVRPSGDRKAKELVPDIQLDIDNMTIEEIIKKVGG